MKVEDQGPTLFNIKEYVTPQSGVVGKMEQVYAPNQPAVEFMEKFFSYLLEPLEEETGIDTGPIAGAMVDRMGSMGISLMSDTDYFAHAVRLKMTIPIMSLDDLWGKK